MIVKVVGISKISRFAAVFTIAALFAVSIFLKDAKAQDTEASTTFSNQEVNISSAEGSGGKTDISSSADKRNKPWTKDKISAGVASPRGSSVEAFKFRAKLFAANLCRSAEKAFKDNKGARVSFCIVSAGGAEFIDSWPRHAEEGNSSAAVPVGAVSEPIISLMALAMESGGKIKLSRRADETDSIFRNPPNAPFAPTMETLLSMKAGITPRLDELFPKDASAVEIFDFIAQTGLSPSLYAQRSKLSLCAAAYLCALAEDKRARGSLEESFKRTLRKNLFLPLKMSSAGFIGGNFSSKDSSKIGSGNNASKTAAAGNLQESFIKALLPAEGITLSAADAAKWLKAELGAEKIGDLDAGLISARRTPHGGSMGFDTARIQGEICEFKTSDRFGHVCVAAIIPKMKVAMFLAVNEQGDNAKVFATSVLADFVNMAKSLEFALKKAN